MVISIQNFNNTICNECINHIVNVNDVENSIKKLKSGKSAGLMALHLNILLMHHFCIMFIHNIYILLLFYHKIILIIVIIFI